MDKDSTTQRGPIPYSIQKITKIVHFLNTVRPIPTPLLAAAPVGFRHHCSSLEDAVLPFMESVPRRPMDYFRSAASMFLKYHFSTNRKAWTAIFQNNVLTHCCRSQKQQSRTLPNFANGFLFRNRLTHFCQKPMVRLYRFRCCNKF